MLAQFNAIVLDVILIVALLSLIAIGVFKGVKHTLLNIGLLVLSLVISFMPFTNIIKQYMAGLLGNIINIGNNVSYSAEHKIVMASLYMFMASLILTLLIYVIARLVKLLIIKVYRKKNGIGRIELSVVSRVFGGIASFFIHGALLILLLSVADNPLVGLDKTLNDSYVSQYVVRVDDIIIDACGGKSENVKANITLLALKGDVLAKINEKDIENFIGASKLLGNGKLEPNTMAPEDAKVTVENMKYILLLQESLFADENGLAKPGYEDMIVLTRNLIDTTISKMITKHAGAEPIPDIESASAVCTKIEKLYGAVLADKFATLFVV